MVGACEAPRAAAVFALRVHISRTTMRATAIVSLVCAMVAAVRGSDVVSLNSSSFKKNVLKCVEAGTPEVYLIVPTKHMARRVRKSLAELLREHTSVSVMTISEFRTRRW